MSPDVPVAGPRRRIDESSGDCQVIEVERISKCFGARLALDGVSLSLPRGEVLGLVGANGSGKSTLLRILATLVPPDEGDVRIGGFSVRSEAARVRETIGYVPEVAGMYPNQTAHEYLEFFAGIHGLPRAGRAGVATQLLELVGLEDRRDDEAESLSSGQRRRLCLARAMVHDPAVLLVEDTSGLDPHARAEFGDLIGELRAIGKTVVISGHHLAGFEELCTWVLMLDSGKAVASGPMAEVTSGRSLSDAFSELTGGPPR